MPIRGCANKDRKAKLSHIVLRMETPGRMEG